MIGYGPYPAQSAELVSESAGSFASFQRAGELLKMSNNASPIKTTDENDSKKPEPVTAQACLPPSPKSSLFSGLAFSWADVDNKG